MTVRVRFAPSPTGHLHIGSLRAALFNWLYARKNKGEFLIRIEDTDLERSKAEYTASILESFAWAGIKSDEPIVIQSERLAAHKSVAQNMLQEGTAYPCFCTPGELKSRLGTNAADGAGYTSYDRCCRDKSFTLEDLKRTHVVRFKVPDNQGPIVFKDLIRGNISFGPEVLDDFIIIRSDGMPTYNFVVVLDDAFMGITQVIRGEDHISNTPKQILIYHACKYKVPDFAHLPLILGPDGNRLSKRDAATSVLDYKANGFLPEALINYLVRLGWSHGDQEVFSIPEMIEHFSLEAVGKKGAIFDIKKLEWLNTLYIKHKTGQELLNLIIKDRDANLCDKVSDWSEFQLIGVLNLYKDRVKTLKELADEIIALCAMPHEYNPLDYKTWILPDTKNYLSLAEEQLNALDSWTLESIGAVLKQLCTTLNIKFPQLAQPLRLSLTGKSASPGVFELINLLGKQEVLKRIETFKKYIV